jgi:hypothetical protein
LTVPLVVAAEKIDKALSSLSSNISSVAVVVAPEIFNYSIPIENADWYL